MAELKTRPTDVSFEDYLTGIDEGRRDDCRTLARMMEQATGAPPVIWGPSIVGFGDYHYEYQSGCSGDWFVIGFAARKREITLYLMAGFEGYADHLARLGKHKLGKCCLYLKRLADVDLAVLDELIRESVAFVDDHAATAAD